MDSAKGRGDFGEHELADCMPQLVWVADMRGRVVYYNERAKQYAGIERQADGTWTWHGVVHADDQERTMVAWNGAVAVLGHYACEHRIQMADGSYRWHVSRAVPRRDASGVTTWCGTATDIHEQKLAQHAAAAANSSRERLLYAIAHDLRTPVSVIGMLMPIVQTVAAGSSARVEDAMASVERQLRRIDQLVSQLMDVATIRSPRSVTLDLARCELVGLVRELIAEYQTLTPARVFELECSASAIVGTWDAARLHRVIGNLVANAAKYSESGPIKVSVREQGDEVVVTVSDQGIGIPEAERPYVFEWFYRGSNVPHGVMGSGIGLAGSRAIVRQHGGELALKPHEGKGSTFEVALPLHAKSTL